MKKRQFDKYWSKPCDKAMDMKVLEITGYSIKKHIFLPIHEPFCLIIQFGFMIGTDLLSENIYKLTSTITNKDESNETFKNWWPRLTPIVFDCPDKAGFKSVGLSRYEDVWK